MRNIFSIFCSVRKGRRPRRKSRSAGAHRRRHLGYEVALPID
jgi:hypothetical protein